MASAPDGTPVRYVSEIAQAAVNAEGSLVLAELLALNHAAAVTPGADSEVQLWYNVASFIRNCGGYLTIPVQ